MTAEDHALLVALDELGHPDAADVMEAEIRRQCDRPHDLDHEAHELLESELGNGGVTVEFIASERAARAAHGAGGGRHRRPEPAGPHV